MGTTRAPKRDTHSNSIRNICRCNFDIVHKFTFSLIHPAHPSLLSELFMPIYDKTYRVRRES